jgi:hypothetical protein
MSGLSVRGTLLAAALGLLFVGAGCSGKDSPTMMTDDVTPGQNENSGPPIAAPSDDVEEGPCVEGEMRACVYYLPAHNGVHPCIRGFQSCGSGTWGDCIEGEMIDGGIQFR